VLLRTLRLLGIKTCEPTEELGGWLLVPAVQKDVLECLATDGVTHVYPDKSVINYQVSRRNLPEQSRSMDFRSCTKIIA
jgi:hypothetical protein